MKETTFFTLKRQKVGKIKNQVLVCFKLCSVHEAGFLKMKGKEMLHESCILS